jgi:hypothetical protein
VRVYALAFHTEKNVWVSQKKHRFCVIALVLVGTQKNNLCFHNIELTAVILSEKDVLRIKWGLRYVYEVEQII